MSNRWLRFGIALLALGAAGAAGFRIYQQEQLLTSSILTARSTDLAAESALTTIPEVKAALHAYVAEGQGHAFWTARAAMLLERLRASLLELDGPAAAAGASVAEVLELADRLGAAEQKARDHVKADQKLLAGEVIFTDARDVLDAMRLQLARTRTQLAESAARTQDEIRREQKLLAVGVFGVLAFATLLLVTPGAAATSTVTIPQGPQANPPDEFESSARIVSRAPVKPGAQPGPGKANTTRPGGMASASSAATAAPTPTVSDRLPVARPATPSAAAPASSNGAGATQPSAATAPPPTSPLPSLREAAAICTELARASQSIEVSDLLARVAKVLDASGAVVWMASADGRELYPAASAGYDERLLARIGTIPRTANNVTAGAIRSGTPKSSARVGQSAAALAVPLLTPLGAVGVLSAELKNVAEVDETRLAVATIFAAQLASLVGSRGASAGASAPAVPDSAHR
jgi:GAF domain